MQLYKTSCMLAMISLKKKKMGQNLAAYLLPVNFFFQVEGAETFEWMKYCTLLSDMHV